MKRISFSLLGIIIATLIGATLLEKPYGTRFVAEHIYGSVAFLVLWILFSVSSLLYLLMRKRAKKTAVRMLHFSFLLILAGAFVTRLFGERGLLHLRLGDEATHFTVAGRRTTVRMPFTIKLKDFRVVYYTGTRAPMDFVSAVTITDAGKDTLVEGEVAMNQILSYRNYRFYQSGYDEDEKGVTLAVAHDPYGIALTYSGYLMLLLSIAGFFMTRHSRFRRLLDMLNTPSPAPVCLWLLFCLCNMPAAKAQEAPSAGKQTSALGEPKTLPREVAAKFGDLYVLYNDRICPLQTLAKDFTVKLYGRASYKGLTAEQVFTGWMFYYTSWKQQPIIKIKSNAVRQILGITGGYASLDDFYNRYNEYKLTEATAKIRRGKATTRAERRSVENADEKYNLIAMLYSGKMIKLFPHIGEDAAARPSCGEVHVVWYSPQDLLPEDMADDEWIFVRRAIDYMHEMVVRKDFEALCGMLAKMKVYQQKKAGRTLPSDKRFGAEKTYNRLEDYRKFLAMACLFLGIASFMFYGKRLVNGRETNLRVDAVCCIFGTLVFLSLTLSLGLRWYISRHVPLSNGFETMQFMAWCTMGISYLLRRKFSLSLPFGFLLCGLALLVAMLSESNPRITQLAPALSSPLLSVHVVAIMIAYSLFAFMMLCGLAAVILSSGRRKETCERLHLVSRIILYPAVFCLAAGIFVGAVWANISWGRYWGWDPKETWALVTLLIYSTALHPDSLPLFRRPMFFHLFSIAAFLCVLITYFGVNFIFGGMHSYG